MELVIKEISLLMTFHSPPTASQMEVGRFSQPRHQFVERLSLPASQQEDVYLFHGAVTRGKIVLIIQMRTVLYAKVDSLK